LGWQPDIGGTRLLSAVERGQVCAHPLRTRLPDMQPGADRTHRGHAPCRDLSRKFLRSLRLKRVNSRPASGRAARCSRGSRHLSRADDHHEELVRADQRECPPRRHRGTDQAMPQAMGHVGREGHRDTQAKELPRQPGHRGTLRCAESSITIELA